MLPILLKDIDILENVSNDVVDGKNVINLFKPESELGKLLDPFYNNKKNIKFLRYKIYSTKALMDFLRLDGYKEEWLGIKIHKNALKKEIQSLDTKIIPSYWGIVTLFLIQKIKGNKELENQLRYNELPFIMYKNEIKEITLFDKKFKMKTKMDNFHNYCKCITLISNIIKNNDFSNDDKVRSILKDNFSTLEIDIDNLLK